MDQLKNDAVRNVLAAKIMKFIKEGGQNGRKGKSGGNRQKNKGHGEHEISDYSMGGMEPQFGSNQYIY